MAAEPQWADNYQYATVLKQIEYEIAIYRNLTKRTHGWCTLPYLGLKGGGGDIRAIDIKCSKWFK